MLKEFKKFIQDENLLSLDSKVLIAVSGGVDSMVLLDLFVNSDWQIAAAHCNFQLRGEESELDEKLVQEYCKRHDVEFFKTRFDTSIISKNNKKGIQETARDLRYGWFNQLLIDKSIDFLATAHHKEDLVETMLFNMSRGTGLLGLKGIDSKRDEIIRPLLFAEKPEIIEYAKSNQIPYREDNSNKSIKYKRNRIRHKIIPELKEINSSLIQTMYKQSKVFREGSDLINKTIDVELKNQLIKDGGVVKISIEYLEKSSYPRLLLWQWLSSCNFSSGAIDDILSLINSQVGKYVEGATHKIYRERSFLVLQELVVEREMNYVFDCFEDLKRCDTFLVDIKMSSELIIEKSNDHAYLDYSNIEYPLVLRKWEAGDRFVPFGRNKKEKVKDFLTHQKVPSHLKSDIQVLCHNDEILWVIGLRINNRFRVVGGTKEVLCLSIEN